MNKFPNIYKLKKHFKKGITPLLCALTVFNLVGINVNAASYSISLPFPEPKVSDTSGYVVLQCFDAKGHSYEYFYYYTVSLLQGSSNLQIAINNQPSGGSLLQFTCSKFSLSAFDGVVGFMSLYLYRVHDNTWERKAYVQMIDENGSYYMVDDFGVPISAFFVKGPYDALTSNVDNLSLSVNFNSEGNITTHLASIYRASIENGNKLDSIDYSVNAIYELLVDNAPSGSITEVSQSEINSVDSKEQALVGSNVSTSDLNVSINPQASSVVWNLIDNAVTGNAKVFAMFISILTIAVIGLILNR